MRLRAIDWRLIIGLFIAHLLFFFSFQDTSIFWYILTASLLVLIIYAMFQKEEVDDKAPFFTYILMGLLTGIGLYAFFWIGIHVLSLLHLSIWYQTSKLYHYYAPNALWRYIALVLVVVPGEELFWRGFVQKRLFNYFKPILSIIIGAVLYASVLVYSHSILLIITFFLSGLSFGILYFWKKSLPLVIVSHLVFNIILFAILPLK